MNLKDLSAGFGEANQSGVHANTNLESRHTQGGREAWKIETGRVCETSRKRRRDAVSCGLKPG